MPVDLKHSFSGGMDTDTAYQQLKKNAYIEARNTTLDTPVGNFDEVIASMNGNRKIGYNFPSGRFKCIGAKPDEVRGTVVYFVWNDQGKHLILKATRTFGTITSISKIFENKTESGGVDILGFTENNKIIHAEIMHRDEGDLLFWTDGNVSPKGMMMDKVAAGTYGTVELAFIEAAKRMPLQPPTVVFGNDGTRTTNNLRKKVFQLRYRHRYDDFTFSCWSPWSEVAIPTTVGTDNDLDATKNNYIAATVYSGKKNVTDIEMGFRTNSGNAWDDLLSAQVLNKVILGISDEASYVYNFYNNVVPVPVDTREADLNYDWIPRLAKVMCKPNGNVLVYAAITEGYDKIADNALSVTMTVSAITNTGVDLGPPALTYTQFGLAYTFTVAGGIPTGTSYMVRAFIGGGGGTIVLSTYTSIGGDGLPQVATGLYNSTPAPYRNTNIGATYSVILPSGSYIIIVAVVSGTSSGTITCPTGLPWYSKYRYGLVYWDDAGRTNGVHSFVNQAGGTADFEIDTGAFSLSGATPQTPAVNLTISHLPPSFATKFGIVRSRNLTYDKMMQYVTMDFQSDSTYYYLGLENIKFYYNLNTSFNYATIRSIWGQGDRVRVIAQVTAGAYSGTIWNHDYEVLGIVTRTLTGGASTDLGDFLKVKIPLVVPSPAYTTNMMVMVYTPAEATTEQSDEAYWEFAQVYDIYSSGGINYHRGMTQDQTAILSANFQFTSGGDYYYRSRSMYTKTLSPTASANLLLFDSHFSDTYPSAVNSNGRQWLLDPNAKQTYFPTTARFGQEFEPNTNINNLNRFYPANFKDYNREFGSILRTIVSGQHMHIFQELRIGTVPVNLQIIRTMTGDKQLIASEELLNNITYYDGEFGVGDAAESVATFGFAHFGADNRKNVIWRLSKDGLQMLSKIYNMDSWTNNNLSVRGGNYKMYGAFDHLKYYVLSLEATVTTAAETLLFNDEEGSRSFDCFADFHPEMMCSLGKTLVTFKNGELWVHDDTVNTCKFYNTQYYPSVTLVFNEQPAMRKDYQAVSYQSDMIWDSSVKGDISTSITNPETNLRQQSRLITSDYEIEEGNRYASFLKDENSMSDSRAALVEGDFLKGTWIKVKFTYRGRGFAWLAEPYVSWQPSERNF